MSFGALKKNCAQEAKVEAVAIGQGRATEDEEVCGDFICSDCLEKKRRAAPKEPRLALNVKFQI